MEKAIKDVNQDQEVNTKVFVLDYGRVSSLDQSTTKEQLEELRDYHLKHEHVIVDQLEEKKSAKEDDDLTDALDYIKLRPVFYSIYLRAKDKKDFNELWVWKWDRFARSDFQEIMIRMFLKLGVKVKPLRGSNDPLGRRVESMISVRENEDKSTRIKLKNDSLLKEGILNCRCSFGYYRKRKVVDGKSIFAKRWFVDKEKSEIVKQIYEEYDGKNLQALAKKFNLSYQKIQYYILGNVHYIGYIIDREGNKIKSKYIPAIITEELFYKINTFI